MDKRFDVNAVDDFGQTPLAVIAHGAFYQPVERVEGKVVALLKAGADVTVQEEGKSLVEIALEYKVAGKVGAAYFPQSVDRFVALLQEAAKPKE